MGLKARVLTLTHFLFTFIFAIVLAVGFASNNWINAIFLKNPHGVQYTSGLFLGCFNFRNRSGLCSTKIAYLRKATFNLDLGIGPDVFLTNLVNLALDMFFSQPIDPNLFTLDEEFFDEGSLTFTNGFVSADPTDSPAIYCSRYLITFGLILVVISAMVNFFLSCVYSVKSTKYLIAVFILGSIFITTGSNIMYISYCIDRLYPNPEMEISMGFGMYLTIGGVIGILFMCVLLSLTLTSVEQAKIKDVEKTAQCVVRETMKTMGTTMQLASTIQATMMSNNRTIMGRSTKNLAMNRTIDKEPSYMHDNAYAPQPCEYDVFENE
ncbi:hypothetical protein RF11_03654 [Thelohanellus kitauei]|uniref:Uncharacterized protein n=1 Tax=Thelohanellus kitauei TaxID=669202 RepID=A0A0C2JSL3_THEKT|nr:hypothetical protein RF11_03654 [Thelohanellus kitauei]